MGTSSGVSATLFLTCRTLTAQLPFPLEACGWVPQRQEP